MTINFVNLKRNLSVVAVVLFSLSVLGSSQFISAQIFDRVIQKETLNIDTSGVSTEGNYSQPQSILITPIFIEDDINIDAEEWYRGLFYYFSSERHNYTDIPVHYVVDLEGNIYEGVEGGVERELVVESSGSGTILIAYLAEQGQRDFTPSAKTALQSLLLQLANENEISADNIEVSALVLEIDEEQNQAALTKKEIFGNWPITGGGFKSFVSARYQPVSKTYSIDLVEFVNPSSKVRIGNEVVLKVKLKNTGNYTMFSDSDSELLLTKLGGEASLFFLNGQWVSQTQAPIFTSDSVLLPGEEKTFDIKISVPLRPGRYSEKFVIKTASGQSLANSEITIDLDIDRGDQKLLEILDTETGTLNVRNSPSSGGSLVGKVSPKERLVWLETQNGWYKIKRDDLEGWVLGKYVREL